MLNIFPKNKIFVYFKKMGKVNNLTPNSNKTPQNVNNSTICRKKSLGEVKWKYPNPTT